MSQQLFLMLVILKLTTFLKNPFFSANDYNMVMWRIVLVAECLHGYGMISYKT